MSAVQPSESVAPSYFLKDPALIQVWLDAHCTCYGPVMLDAEGRVSVTGSVIFDKCDYFSIERLAVQFDTVSQNFDCSNGNLQTLTGSPTHVGGKFICYNCSALKNLEGAPRYVGGDFDCCGCWALTTLQGAPQQVLGGLACWGCTNLVDLTGAPHQIGGHFDCGSCVNLMTLKGAPQRLENGTLSCRGNTRLHTFSGLDIVAKALEFSEINNIDATFIQHCLQHRVEFITDQRTEWIAMVNTYHQSGDILAAIAHFESYFKVPFQVTEPTILTDQELLHL